MAFRNASRRIIDDDFDRLNIMIMATKQRAKAKYRYDVIIYYICMLDCRLRADVSRLLTGFNIAYSLLHASYTGFLLFGFPRRCLLTILMESRSRRAFMISWQAFAEVLPFISLSAAARLLSLPVAAIFPGTMLITTLMRHDISCICRQQGIADNGQIVTTTILMIRDGFLFTEKCRTCAH